MPVYRTLFPFFLAFSFTAVYGMQLPGNRADLKTDIGAYEKLIIHYRYDKPDSALYFAKKGMELARRTNDQEGVARMLTQMGMIDDNSGRADSSRGKYLKALEIYEQLGIKKGIIRENIRLGAVENRDGNFDRSNGYFLVALKLSEKSRDQSGIMESYINLGEVSAHRGAINKAFKYFQRAEAIYHSLPFSNLRLNLYSDLGAAYRQKGDFATAVSY
ncbi:MAG TPA: tetratricopeptide repeat protein, partial [Pedobacter sp.]